jgi:hypothetical protein
MHADWAGAGVTSANERSPKVCGSRIEPDGRVVITTPSANCQVGDVLYVRGSLAELAGETQSALGFPRFRLSASELEIAGRLGLLDEPLADVPSENGRASGDEGAPVELEEAEA